MTQTTQVLFLGSQNLCSTEIVTQNVPPCRRPHSDQTTQAEQLLDDSLPLIYHYISCVRLFQCCDLVYTQIATKGRGHVQRGVHVPAKYCQFRRILQITNWTKISEVINSSFFGKERLRDKLIQRLSTEVSYILKLLLFYFCYLQLQCKRQDNTTSCRRS